MEKIPHKLLPERYEQYHFIDSSLVKVPSDFGILIDMQYPKMGMENAISECLLREEVLKKILEAKTYLPENLTFKIWDAYRPLALQKEIYNKYKEKIIQEFSLQNLSLKQQEEIINCYVSFPNEDEKLAPLHVTGGAIDLGLTNIKTGKDLEFGTPFDSFSNLTKTNAFEREGMNEKIRDNRRILYYAMTKAGFTNLPSEYWHFDYGNKAWAFYKKKPIIYKGIFDLSL